MPRSNIEIDEMIEMAEVIFIGATDGVLIKESGNLCVDRIPFDVRKLFKGSLKQDASIIQGGSSCDWSFAPKQNYLFFARNGFCNSVQASGCRIYVFDSKNDVVNKIMQRLSNTETFALVQHAQLPLLRVEL